VDRGFDGRHGSETHRIVENADLADVTSPNLAHGIRYEPTPAVPFQRLMRAAAIPARGTFVDIGCGKGRTLMLAGLLGFERVTGVEYAPSLCAIARRNLDRLRTGHGLQLDATLHAIDATEYAFTGDDTVVYLFNPFDDTVLSPVLENLRASLAAHPRTVWLIYSRPVWRRVVEESRLFSQVEDYSTGGRVNAVFRTD
jgi:SAM-dependent methyltransferase